MYAHAITDAKLSRAPQPINTPLLGAEWEASGRSFQADRVRRVFSRCFPSL